jgi:Arc/MetJ-type ribon-helix-helix transcriptional regulator
MRCGGLAWRPWLSDIPLSWNCLLRKHDLHHAPLENQHSRLVPGLQSRGKPHQGLDVRMDACILREAVARFLSPERFSMSSGLSPENEQFLARAVSAGVYNDRDEALDDAVDLLRRREKLIEDVNHGIEQIDRGEAVQFDLSEMKAALRRHLQSR